MNDVVIVGAGPAGSRMGMLLAKKGFDVTILERRKEIGIPVRCGEGIGPEVLEAFNLKPEKDWANTVRTAELFSPKGSSFKIEKSNGFVVERMIMDKLMVLRAVEAGAKVLTGTTVTEYGKGWVKARSSDGVEEFRARLIIGADGVESNIARMAGLIKNVHPHELDSCMQYELAGINVDPRNLEFYFGNEVAPRGYVWVFPKGDGRANVGVGIAGDDKRPAKYFLDKFIKEKYGSASVIRVSSGNITVTKPMTKTFSDNLLIVGTAAQHVSPLHGGGIWDAIRGADVAASVAIPALERDDLSANTLGEAQKLHYEKYGKLQEWQYKLRNAMEAFTDDDYDHFIKNFTNEMLDQMGSVEGVLKLMRLLMQKPNVGAIVKGFLS